MSENNTDPNLYGSYSGHSTVSKETPPSPVWKVLYWVNTDIDRKQLSLISQSGCLTLTPYFHVHAQKCLNYSCLWICAVLSTLEQLNNFLLVSHKLRSPELDTGYGKRLSCITNSQKACLCLQPCWSVVSKPWLLRCLQGTVWPHLSSTVGINLFKCWETGEKSKGMRTWFSSFWKRFRLGNT